MLVSVVSRCRLRWRRFRFGVRRSKRRSRQARRGVAHIGRWQYRTGVGSQPRPADLRPGGVVDRFSRSFCCSNDDAFGSIDVGPRRNCVAWIEFCVAQIRQTFAQARLFGTVFAGSSLITPFFFGTVAGGIALRPGSGGRIHPSADSTRNLLSPQRRMMVQSDACTPSAEPGRINTERTTRGTNK
jgi:hypothetical protein